MRLNQLDGLLAFWKVAEHRGFTAAAAALEVSPSALSQAIRQLETRLGVRLLNRTTRSVSLTEAGEAYLSRIGPALSDVLDAGEQLHALQGRPSGMLRINAARISTAMVLQPLLAGFLKAYPDVQVELTTDEGYVDIVERGFDAGVRLGESVQKDMVAVPLGGPVAVAIVGSPEYFKRYAVPRHPPTWCITTACDSGSPAAGPSTSGNSRSTADSSSTSSAAISRSATHCSRSRLRWRESDWRTRSSSLRFPTSSQATEARLDQLLTDVSRVLPVLPQQAAAAFQVEGFRGLRAGGLHQSPSRLACLMQGAAVAPYRPLTTANRTGYRCGSSAGVPQLQVAEVNATY